MKKKAITIRLDDEKKVSDLIEELKPFSDYSIVVNANATYAFIIDRLYSELILREYQSDF